MLAYELGAKRRLVGGGALAALVGARRGVFFSSLLSSNSTQNEKGTIALRLL